MHHIVRRWVKEDKGSAIVEFVALAIPLFIPIFIYLNNFASVSGNEAIVRVLAREGLRAYVASDSDHAGREVSAQALTVIAQHLGLTASEIQTLTAKYDCSNNPCLSSNGRIRLTVSYIDEQSHRTIEASAQEHVSPWM
jgi:Flp pilus assembly protein TadG